MKMQIKRFLNKNFPIMMTKYYYKKIVGEHLDLNNPESLNEKINWLKLFYWPHVSISRILADKYKVRDYVKSKGFKDILIPMIGAWEKVEDIDWKRLPNQFVIKCGHGCGMNIICYDKNELDISKAKFKLFNWMRTDWGLDSCEPHYSKIKPMIISEKFIGNNKVPPDDIKIHCFHGKPRLIAYYSGRYDSLQATFYDTYWNNLNISENQGSIVDKPDCLDDLLKISSQLSKNLPYARVDFYIVKDKPAFGEITLTPASGRSLFMSKEADLYYGKFLDLSMCEVERK